MKHEDIDKRFSEAGIFNYNSEGFDIAINGVTSSIKWSDIEKLSAYKIDLLVIDEICLEIVLKNKVLTISEETKGWYQFIEKFTVALEGVNIAWENEVVEKPFKPQWTIVYERSDKRIPDFTNFYSIVNAKFKEEVCKAFEQENWSVRKSGWDEFELSNTWSELVLQENGEDLLLNGAVIYNPDNVKMLRAIYDSFGTAYQFEFYNANRELLEAVWSKKLL